MTAKRVYFFGGPDGAEGRGEQKDLLGGKGAGLAEMCRLGLPVPPGFTITTEVCREFYDVGGQLPEALRTEVDASLARVETIMGARFGDRERPLLVSVRSGARVSMPGMMDTVLNLGLNDDAARGLARATGNERFAWDCYRRFVQMYGDVVMGLKAAEDEHDPFEVMLDARKRRRGAATDAELTAEDLRELVAEYKNAIRERTGSTFPDDPRAQLWEAIAAVFRSWQNDRAVAYRELHRIPAAWGTAVTVQSMVFGNMGDDSGTGVAFTRDPATGENRFYGEFLMNAQGEDVVAGVRTPLPIAALQKTAPEVYAQLEGVRRRLESHYHDMQDLEFTIQQGRLWILQTRSGKRTGRAAIKIAVDMVQEGLIDQTTAVQRIPPDSLNHLLRPVFDPGAKRAALAEGRLLARGLPAGPGAATGAAVFTAREAEEAAARGERPVLVRMETSPEDIRGMNAAEGILTARGGMTSHAALVARQMGKVCVVGCEAISVNYAAREMRAGNRVIRQGEAISLDGSSGEVIAGPITTRPSEVLSVILGGGDARAAAETPEDYRLFQTLMTWADEARAMEVWTNADQPDQAAQAVALGAQGIGLCRTEHMFFGGDRIQWVREMILAPDDQRRRNALAQLEPLQREDFKGIFRAMGGRPVTIRLLDPPLHEFLPPDDATRAILAQRMGLTVEAIEEASARLHEFNPMLGHRGCRLGITTPEIYEMQVRAVVAAAAALVREGVAVRPEIMVPLVAHPRELELIRRLIERVAAEVCASEKTDVAYRVGTMIELPRACVAAGEIARHADFFSFGTNDLTQTAFGLSRDDAGRFLNHYVGEGAILEQDPFVSVDREGVGELMRIAVEKGRAMRAGLKIGICGEHGGDPSSVEFCHDLGLDYVSCSPFRLPIARLAAAQAALKRPRTAGGRRAA